MEETRLPYFEDEFSRYRSRVCKIQKLRLRDSEVRLRETEVASARYKIRLFKMQNSRLVDIQVASSSPRIRILMKYPMSVSALPDVQLVIVSGHSWWLGSREKGQNCLLRKSSEVILMVKWVTGWSYLKAHPPRLHQSIRWFNQVFLVQPGVFSSSRSSLI